MSRHLAAALLAFACGGDITAAGDTPHAASSPLAPAAAAPVAVTTAPVRDAPKPNVPAAPKSIAASAVPPVAAPDAGEPVMLPIPTPQPAADAGPSGDAGGADARVLLPLDCACHDDGDCASGWCRPTFAMCGDPSTLPLASGLLCASDAECASGHCDPLYYDPAHQVSHNCR